MTDDANQTKATKYAYRTEEGDWIFPDGMCEVVTSVNIGYGPDEEIPCGAKATFEVKYQLFIPYDPETHEENFWVDCTETVCDTHRGQMVSSAEESPEMMQIDTATLLPGIETILPESDNSPESGEKDTTDDGDMIVETTPDGYILHTWGSQANVGKSDGTVGPIEWDLWYANLNPDSRF